MLHANSASSFLGPAPSSIVAAAPGSLLRLKGQVSLRTPPVPLATVSSTVGSAPNEANLLVLGEDCIRKKPKGQVGYFYVAALPESLAELLPLARDVDPEIYLALYNKLARASRY